MKRYYLLLLTLMSYCFPAAGQEKMIVREEDWIAYTYQDASKTVSSLKKLPQNIQKEVSTLMEESFFGFKDSIHFVNAQIVDIASYLKDGDPHKRHWIVPKYELNFYLQDRSIGIIRYNIILHLDVSVIIDYPLRKEYQFELVSDTGFTRALLLTEISKAYSKIYEEEGATAAIKTIPIKDRTLMYNRNETDGKHGIWGQPFVPYKIRAEIAIFKL